MEKISLNAFKEIFSAQYKNIHKKCAKHKVNEFDSLNKFKTINYFITHTTSTTLISVTISFLCIIHKIESQFMVTKLDIDKEGFQISFVEYEFKQVSDTFVLLIYVVSGQNATRQNTIGQNA